MYKAHSIYADIAVYGFAAIDLLSFGELFGGKICAALDRQHPRDLFDVKLLLENEGINQSVKEGFLVSLLGHNRPPYEILKPNIQNHEKTFEKEFFGMTEKSFSYEEHLKTLHRLIDTITKIFTEQDKQFLLSFFSAEPQWNLLEIENLQMRMNNIQKFEAQLQGLRKVLF